ncbi:hypothetical protein RSal33209_1416 [Renibacterium salmoninarum ATCC 33209]|uniref:Uncharacterized protein n=1 Tax=Renibacterium salmoninarum (strain ATCC 33209 / DSM 20767 / JCM 11484 / NBRC 15589 / NCIMB 2235) TaxID=288705 RepID=A9WQ07_RENSM|nr:hypothetical protein [Renibacterium salmoninarum]ABY23153.1 hypothetical protein RSal33209_1416 [Renibacterium salmoninarum ATCC 33209]
MGGFFQRAISKMLFGTLLFFVALSLFIASFGSLVYCAYLEGFSTWPLPTAGTVLSLILLIWAAVLLKAQPSKAVRSLDRPLDLPYDLDGSMKAPSSMAQIYRHPMGPFKAKSTKLV